MLLKLDLVYTTKQGSQNTHYFFQPEYKVLLPIKSGDVPIFASWEFIMQNGISVSKKVIEDILQR